MAIVSAPGGASFPAAPLLVFDVSEALCAFRLGEVREVLHMAELSRPPAAPSVLEGFLNLAGAAVAVFRLERLLQLRESPVALHTPLVLLHGSPYPLGLVVRELKQIVSIEPSELRPIEQPIALNGCVEAELTLNGEPLYLLSSERILFEKERKCIDELRRMEQRRLDGLNELSC